MTVASWMWRPIGGRLFVAERGRGAWADGQRLLCPAVPHDVGDLTGAVLIRFLDEATRSIVGSNAHRFAHVTAGRMCVGVEYPMIAEGDSPHAASSGARMSSARNDGSSVRVLASAAWSAASDLDSDLSATSAFKPPSEGDRKSSRRMLDRFFAWKGGTRSAPRAASSDPMACSSLQIEVRR